MKFALAVLVVLAVSSPLDAWKVPRTGTGALADEAQDFVNILPLNQMLSILFRYIANDAEFQQLLSYMHSKEFQNLISDIEALPEVLDLLNYIQKAGLDIYLLVNNGNDYLGLPRLKVPTVVANFKPTGGIRGFLDEIEAIYPKQAVRNLYEYKMAHSKVFSDFIARLRWPSTQKIADAILSNPNFNGLLTRAEKAGIKVEDVKEFLEKLFGIKVIPPK